MVEKFITPQRNVIDFARYQQGLAVVKTLAFSKRLCRHCGAALADPPGWSTRQDFLGQMNLVVSMLSQSRHMSSG